MKHQKREKKRQIDDLDTETTFADMNVEGFRWYRPKGSAAMPELDHDERKAMLRGAFAAFLPIVFGAIAVFAVLAGLMYLWLG